jgi:RNA polymerase sigma-70 factor, ECF subfamily
MKTPLGIFNHETLETHEKIRLGPNMSEIQPVPELLLTQARGGDAQALGRLLELYRNYLRVVARAMIGQALRARVDASDLVQETFLKAHREFRQFLGSSEPELTAWLRQILVRTMANQARHHRRHARDYKRDEPLEALLERSSSGVQQALAAPLASPSSIVSRREQAVLLADALEKMPADYREVFLLRNVEHIPFEEIAVRMGRSPGAARMLWTGTIRKLSQLLEEL